MKKKKIRNRKGSFMVEPKDYRCSLSKLGLERKNLKALSEKDNDQLGTIVKEAYISGMSTSQRAIFDHVDATLSMITKIARCLGVSTRKIFDLYLEVGKKGFLSKKVARQFASLGFPVFSEISLNTDVSVEEVNQAIIDEKITAFHRWRKP